MKIKRSRDQSFQILASNLVNMVRSQAILYKFMHNRNKYDAWSNKPGRYGGEEGGSHGLCQATLSGKPTWDQLVHMLIPMHTVIIFFVSYRHQLPELEKGREKKVRTWCLQRLWPNRQSRLMQRTANMWFIIIFIISSLLFTLYHNWLMISFFDKDPKYLLNQYCLVRVDYSFDINNLHTITLVRTTFIWKSERSMDSPRVVWDF